jgi:hypothetical protein
MLRVTNENILKYNWKIRRPRIYRKTVGNAGPNLFCEVLLGVVHRTAFLSEMRRNALTDKEGERERKKEKCRPIQHMDR